MEPSPGGWWRWQTWSLESYLHPFDWILNKGDGIHELNLDAGDTGRARTRAQAKLDAEAAWRQDFEKKVDLVRRGMIDWQKELGLTTDAGIALLLPDDAADSDSEG